MGKSFQEKLNTTLGKAVQRGFMYAGDVITKALTAILDTDMPDAAKLDGIRKVVDEIASLNNANKAPEKEATA